MSRDFYQLCYGQYQQEMKEAETLYQRAGVMLVALPLLSTATVAIGRIDILKLCFMRVDAFLYYFAFVVIALSIASSFVFLFLCVYPRKYETLATMDVWHKWRDDYQKHLSDAKGSKAAGDADELDTATIDNLCSKLVEAQPINAQINEKRRKAFQKSVLTAAIALAGIGLQALMYLILKIQGV